MIQALWPSSGFPTPADTRDRAPRVSAAKHDPAIVSPGSTARIAGVGDRHHGAAGHTELLDLPFEKNAIQRPSGEKNALRAASIPESAVVRSSGDGGRRAAGRWS